jgi:hypothetical protein
MIILEKNDHLAEATRDPYLIIAYEAAGKIGK